MKRRDDISRELTLHETPSLKLNQSPKRLKLMRSGYYDPGLENLSDAFEMSNKPLTLSRYSESVPGRLSAIENNQQHTLSKLNKSNEVKSQQIIQLKNKIMTLKTQKANQEFENFKADDEYIKLKEKLNVINGQLDELKHHEAESLRSLQDKYNITTKSMELKHEDRLQKLKENISKDVESIISENFKKLEDEKTNLLNKCEEISKQIKAQELDLNRKLIKLKEDHNKKIIQLNNTLDESIVSLKTDFQSLDKETIEKKNDLIRLQHNLEEVNSKGEKLNSKHNQIKDKYKNQYSEIEELRNNINKNKEGVQQVRDLFPSRLDEVNEWNNKADILNNELLDLEDKRRILHNKLQELKGNIRVYCRIRPSNSGEQADMYVPNDLFNEDATQELVIEKASNEDTGSYSLKNTTYRFQFDKLFLERQNNLDVFTEISQLVQSSLDGYNVCVFAYGQTGSGKSYTMSHGKDGMITLSIRKIFQDINDLKKRNWNYSISGQFLEIYNESIIDLLCSGQDNKKHEIKHDDISGTTSITNMTSVNIASIEQAQNILEQANKKRSTASTKSNERSSRSHSIFMLRLQGKNSLTGEIADGTLNLIDLAGSERLSQSQAKGDRLKETQSINKSLSSLGDVIYSLGKQQAQRSTQNHIPYRNSKLTYLLKHSLGGNSKTLMFVNISPLKKDLNETINSLRFATKVNGTKLGKK